MILVSKGADTLSLALIKQHIVVEHNLDDAIIQHYSDMSFATAETYINHSITDEEYTSMPDALNTYKIPHKPSKVEIYNLGVLVKEVVFSYVSPYITIVVDDDVYDEVKAFVIGNKSLGITQARLLQIGTSYKTRESEDFANMKETSMAATFLYDLNASSIL